VYGKRYINGVIRSSESCPSRLGNTVDRRCDHTYAAAVARRSSRRIAHTLLHAHASNLQHSGTLPALFFEQLSVRWATALHKGEHSGRVNPGLVSELLAGLSPAPLTTRGLLMAVVIIPHLLSIPRWLGKPRLLTSILCLPTGRQSCRSSDNHTYEVYRRA